MGPADRIRYQRVNERTGDEVEHSDIVKGADVGSD
jgi:DNA end-binding protein Ku